MSSSEVEHGGFAYTQPVLAFAAPRRTYRWNPHSAVKATEAGAKGLAYATEGMDDDDEAWRDAAQDAAVAIAKRQRTFTVNDVWRALMDADGYEWQPRTPSIMGAITSGMVKMKLIEPIYVDVPGQPEPVRVTVPSDRASTHGRRLTVWRSLIYEGAQDGNV